MTWGADVVQTISTAVVGDLVKIVNKEAAMGPLATARPADPARRRRSCGTPRPAALEDAQVSVFLGTNIVKDYVARYVDPNMPKLGDQMTANVNIGQECNAFFDGKTINFFQSSTKCQNTGLLEDVIYHEFGHALHVARDHRGRRRRSTAR